LIIANQDTDAFREGFGPNASHLAL
jgi:hypothetical protein